MYIENVRVRNFRCFSEKKVNFSPGVNLLIGKNGRGKTSLIEAIYLLLTGSSFRSSETLPLIRQVPGAQLPEMLVEGVIHHGSQGQLASTVRCQSQGRRRQLSVNGKTTTSVKLQQLFPKILFVPESLSAIKGGPEERRNLMDQALALLQPQQIEMVATYKRALQQKNKLLKLIREGEISAAEGKKTLKSLNPVFLERAFHLTIARQNLLKSMLPYLQKAFRNIFPEAIPVDISVEYLISGSDALEASEAEVVNALSQALAERFEVEVQAGKSLVGPHKHDINFLFNSRDARSYCSQGQQRALVLAFQMAQIQKFGEEHGRPPLLLLDDVLSELDLEKQFFLLSFLKGLSAQIFITTTNLTTITQFDSSMGQVFELESEERSQDQADSGEEGVRV